MTSELSDSLVQTWVTGWARTRGYAVRHEGTAHAAGPRAEAKAWEYVVFAPDQAQLDTVVAAALEDPARLLTVIAEPDSSPLGEDLGGLALLSDEEKLMIADMAIQDVEDPITPDGYRASRQDHDAWTLFTVTHEDDVAARGRMAVVDDYCILDRIYTAPGYRRQGLGTFVTRALLAIAHEHNVAEGLLVATGDGQQLYEYLGWSVIGTVQVFGSPGASDRRRPSHSQIDEKLAG